MGRKCCVHGCRTNYQSQQGRDVEIKLSVYRLPKDENQKRAWLSVIPNDNLVATKNTVVCELHWPAGFETVNAKGSQRPKHPPSIWPVLTELELKNLWGKKPKNLPSVCPGMPNSQSPIVTSPPSPTTQLAAFIKTEISEYPEMIHPLSFWPETSASHPTATSPIGPSDQLAAFIKTEISEYPDMIHPPSVWPETSTNQNTTALSPPGSSSQLAAFIKTDIADYPETIHSPSNWPEASTSQNPTAICPIGPSNQLAAFIKTENTECPEIIHPPSIWPETSTSQIPPVEYPALTNSQMGDFMEVMTVTFSEMKERLLANDKDLPAPVIAFMDDDVLRVQSKAFLNGVPLFVINISPDQRFENFHLGVRCSADSLTKNRIVTLSTWISFEENVRYLNSMDVSNKKQIIHQQLQVMGTQQVGKPRYTPEVIIRAFQYSSLSRCLYEKLRNDFQLPSVSALNRMKAEVAKVDKMTYSNDLFGSLQEKQIVHNAIVEMQTENQKCIAKIIRKRKFGEQ